MVEKRIFGQNQFYNQDFDEARYRKPRERDYRSQFQRDRDHIVHSSSFRRLQAKTQIFLSGEYDFYRTRLTHSLEVAQIGTSICTWLKSDKYEEETGERILEEGYCIDRDLVEAICLSHDIGHPPFGHAGERALNEVMKEYGGFEGNAQSLRVLTELIKDYTEDREGMNPTRALMDGIMKYKALYDGILDNHFLYTDQEKCRSFVFDKREIPQKYLDPKALNEYKSIECQIMDLADDIAYRLMDLSDGLKSRILTLSKLTDWLNKQQDQDLISKSGLRKIVDGETSLVEFIPSKVGQFIQATRIKEREDFMTSLSNRYAYELTIDKQTERELKLLNKISTELIFSSPSVQQLDFKGE